MQPEVLVVVAALTITWVAMVSYRVLRELERRRERERATEAAREAARRAASSPPSQAAQEEQERPPKARQTWNLRLVMQVVVTLAGLGGGGFVLLVGGYSPAAENVASGLVGSVIGFWLK
jgi:hypothetical protein